MSSCCGAFSQRAALLRRYADCESRAVLYRTRQGGGPDSHQFPPLDDASFSPRRRSNSCGSPQSTLPGYTDRQSAAFVDLGVIRARVASPEFPGPGSATQPLNGSGPATSSEPSTSALAPPPPRRYHWLRPWKRSLQPGPGRPSNTTTRPARFSTDASPGHKLQSGGAI